MTYAAVLETFVVSREDISIPETAVPAPKHLALFSGLETRHCFQHRQPLKYPSSPMHTWAPSDTHMVHRLTFAVDLLPGDVAVFTRAEETAREVEALLLTAGGEIGVRALVDI